ncbi:MAG: hypothetical protein HQ506_10075 [Candidatus Marinimicrobia bacterium]|nr:hypothetical protein [Candidatus Neomarinimicrobiota bacterium]
MYRVLLFILVTGSPLSVCLSQSWSGDTLQFTPITFDEPSPLGWNAQYKTVVNFPDDDSRWSQIFMVQTLKCDTATAGDAYPCGEWDYIWNIFIEVPQGDSTELFTLGSFVTPYGKRLKLGGESGWKWVYDITEYAPLLKGARNIIAGNNQELLNLQFLFIRGTPARQVLSVENVYPYGEYKYEYLSTDSLLKERQIVLSEAAAAFSLKATISGHGHAGPYNCCEWDSKTHTYRLNSWETYRWNVWKDCGNNPIYPQGGTWAFDRAGWCPGTKVDEYMFELTPKVSPGDTITLDYTIEPFMDNGEKDGTLRMSHQLFSFGPPHFNYNAAVVQILVPNAKDQYSRMNPSGGNPIIIIKNEGAYPIRDLNITYGIAGHRKKKFNWKGNLEFLESEEVVLPALSRKQMRESGRFQVHLVLPKPMLDEYPENNTLTSHFQKPVSFPHKFVLSIQTNNLGRSAENKYYISDMSGLIWYYMDDFKDSTNYRIPVDLAKGMYQFKFSDEMEDGISRHWWNRNAAPSQVGMDGLVLFESMSGDTLLSFPPDFGQELLFDFIVE